MHKTCWPASARNGQRMLFRLNCAATADIQTAWECIKVSNTWRQVCNRTWGAVTQPKRKEVRRMDPIQIGGSSSLSNAPRCSKFGNVSRHSHTSSLTA